jgi:sodium pump decarboxylase gamma subunit
MVAEGLRLMAVGMFTVFAFLVLLVGLMKLSAAFFERTVHWFAEDEPASGPSPPRDNDDEVAVAIALAEAMRRGQRV